MVDLDKIRGGDDSGDDSGGGSGSGNTTEKETSSKPSSVDKDTEPYSIDSPSEPGEMQMSDTSKEWANEHGELAFDVKGGESLQEYVSRQIDETSELYDNIQDMASKHMGAQEEFTLYFHTLMLNLSNNRLGIMGKLRNEFGKSEKDALKLTRKICNEAGERKMVDKILNAMVKKLWDYEDPE